MKYTVTVSLSERNKHLLTSQFFLSFLCSFHNTPSVSPSYYLLEHFKIICTHFLETENSTEPQNIVTWISISLEILDEPPCCVRQCGTSFLFYILGVLALNFYFAPSLHNTCSSSGSLFFAHLGGIIFIVHYICKFITDPINYIFFHLLHNCTIN